MTAEHDEGERLRAALARSVAARTPSPAPVERIIAAGRARRRRRRAALAAAAVCVTAAAVLVPLTRSAGGPAPAVEQVPADPAPSATAPSRTDGPGDGPYSASAGHGTVDGEPWSLTLTYYPTEAALPSGLPRPDGVPLLCQRPVIGGVLVDHQAGPWAGCTPVDGPEDGGVSGEMALRGLQGKGTTGSRLFVSDTGPHVSYGVVRLSDGTELTGRAATVPGTVYRAWAVAVPDGKLIASVDEYDAGHHRLSHSTDEWR
jgi:hypothetical protein